MMFAFVGLLILGSLSLPDESPASHLENASFELLDSRTGLPAAWSFTSLPGQADLVRYQTRLRNDDQSSRALTIMVKQSHPERRVSYNAHQELRQMAPGKSYRVSGQIRSEGLQHAPYLVVQCFDRDETKMLVMASTPQQPIEHDIAQWQKVELVVTVPENTGLVRLRAGLSVPGNAGGTAWFDDLAITELEQ